MNLDLSMMATIADNPQTIAEPQTLAQAIFNLPTRKLDIPVFSVQEIGPIAGFEKEQPQWSVTIMELFAVTRMLPDGYELKISRYGDL